MANLVLPGDFIPVAEETGLIAELDKWVLENAARQLAHWQHDLPQLVFRVAINISAQTFQSTDLAGFVEGLINRYMIPGERLELEVTERSMMSGAQQSVERMAALKALGITLSIDDFGTHYSSLAYLKKLPIDIIKIDQSFIRELLTDRNNASIVMAIMSMAKAMDLRTVAEGVETERQLKFLEQIQCDIFQGYLLSKPLSAEAFEQWLSQQALDQVRDQGRESANR